MFMIYSRKRMPKVAVMDIIVSEAAAAIPDLIWVTWIVLVIPSHKRRPQAAIVCGG